MFQKMLQVGSGGSGGGSLEFWELSPQQNIITFNDDYSEAYIYSKYKKAKYVRYDAPAFVGSGTVTVLTGYHTNGNPDFEHLFIKITNVKNGSKLTLNDFYADDSSAIGYVFCKK